MPLAGEYTQVQISEDVKAFDKSVTFGHIYISAVDTSVTKYF